MRANKVNVMANLESQVEKFCKVNSILRSDIRRIKGYEDLFGMWQGDLYILDLSDSSVHAQRVVDEAVRRGMVIKYRDSGSTL